MISLHINKRMLLMKLHFFLFMGGVSSVLVFSPTVGKQLGYSPLTIGLTFMYLSMVTCVVKPIFGIIVDKFPVKRFVFLGCILLSGIAPSAMLLLQKLPTEAPSSLSCDVALMALNVSSNESTLKLLEKNIKPFSCRLSCEQSELFRDEMCKSWNLDDYCNTFNNTIINNELDYSINASLIVNITNQIENNIVLLVKSVQINDSRVISRPVCQTPVTTRCEIISCSDDLVMELVTVLKFKGSVFSLPEYWKYFIIITIIWFSVTVVICLQDPICLGLLGDNISDFGKQRCWASISWGIFSMFAGVLVDYFSDSDYQKNYTPIYCLCFITILFNFAASYNIKITETRGSVNMFSNIFHLLIQLDVIVFMIWVVVCGVCTFTIWNFLFWYMEDVTRMYQSDSQSWIKTIQGVAVGIQCTSEIPVLFFSGWIIKRIGHWNCMALGMFVFAVRFYLYSIITDPIWFLPVEMTNGITFGLCFAVFISYARIIAPPDSVTTFLGFITALFEGVGLSLGGLIGGYIYENYNGIKMYRSFSCGSLIMCIIIIIFTKFRKSAT